MIKKNEIVMEQITKMYKKYLLRDPDRDGLLHWINQINNNQTSFDELEKQIKDSPEFHLAQQFKQGFTNTSEGFDLWVHPNDQILSRSIVYDKIWEPETTKLIKKIIHEGDVGIDLGANIGYFTILMANLVGTSGKIFSFEPAPQNFEILQKNIKQNHLENVISEQSAIGDIDGKIKLYLSNTNAGWHKVFPTQFVDYEVSDKNIDVKICSLDKEFIDKKIDFIKMDVEGYEWNAIQGGEKILEENYNIKLIFEFFPMALRANNVKPDAVLTYLLDIGFHIYVIDENMRLLDFSIDEFCTRHAKHSSMNLFCERS
jgi:FkbM family methyltransferase